MTKKHSTKRTLIASILVLCLCLTSFIGTTFAWFTDSVTSSGNIIKSGKLDVTMEWFDGTKAVPASDSDDWTDASTGAIFNNQKWEPGYTEAKHIKIANEGTLALKYAIRFMPDGEVSKLAEVIDVYYADPAKQITDRTALTDDMKIGTLAEVIANMGSTASGSLKATENHTVTLVLKMREEAGDEYQDKSIGSSFAIQLVATQETYESDSFDDLYDKDAGLDWVVVYSQKDLVNALTKGEKNLVLGDNITLADTIVISEDTNINGNGYTINRTSGISTFSLLAAASQPFLGNLIVVKPGATLELTNVTVDGGATWTGEIDETLQRGTVNEGLVANGALVNVEGNGNLILGEGSVVQNNAGAIAIYLVKSGGGSLTLNGGHILNNHADGGAIWAGGKVTINEGSKINYNSSASIGGAIRVVSTMGTLTMNGGEINHNKATTTGGAIWGGNNASYYFNGGEMAYNSATSGGAIWTGTYESYTFSGDFKLHDNKATASDGLGGAIRFCDHASLTMTGGSVYNNTLAGNDNAFYFNNNSVSITGGAIDDNFSFSGGLGLVIGEATVDGVINYNLSTNHNTAYLAESFNSFKFTVNESAANFEQFNFKPASGYTYTEGDEAKLICMNNGYETYWDSALGCFKLQAK